MTQGLEEQVYEFEAEMGEDPLALNPFHFLPIIGTPAYINRVKEYFLKQGKPDIKFNAREVYRMLRKGSRVTKKIAYNIIIIRLFQAGVGAKVLERLYQEIAKAF